MATFRLSVLVFLIGLLSSVTSFAEQSAAETVGDVERLAADLDAGEFATRQAAAQRLSELGQAAFPVLEKAAQSESREASARALDILKNHYNGGDAAAQAAAKEALQRLAKSDQPAVARRAGEALAPPKPIATAVPANFRVVRPANIQIRVQAGNIIGGNNIRRVHTRTVNGVKEINAGENGRKVRIVVDPNGIQIEVSETKDGKATLKKYSAKSAEELKTKHPEAHQIYDQYSKDGGPIQGGFRIAPGVVPGPAFPGNAGTLRGLDDSIRAMESSIEKLRQRGGDNEAVRRTIESMESSKRRLQEMRARIAER